MAIPPSSPATTGRALRVRPERVELRAGDSQAFDACDENGDVVTDVDWSLSDARGTIREGGFYVTPDRVWRTRQITVRAQRRSDSARGTATVELTPLRTWTRVLGCYWVLVFLVLLSILWRSWTYVCPTCRPQGPVVSPPLVSLGPNQSQHFSADTDVTWTNTATPAGVYVAPGAVPSDQVVSVTATSTQDARRTGSAYVRLSPAGGLRVYPPHVSLAPGKSVTFVPQLIPVPAPSPSPTPSVDWLQPTAGTITSAGQYTAPGEPPTGPVVVFARARLDGTELIAAAHVTVTREPSAGGQDCTGGTSPFRLLVLVALLGALGGLVHGMSSFGSYVGSRQLKPSWLWWYFLKPVQGAAVAIVAFLVFRLGVGTPDLGLSSWDCLKAGGFAALVGLFAEPATLKLRDIFEVVFTPRRDTRLDKGGSAAAPSVTAVAPRSVRAGAAATVIVTGANFGENCKATLDGKAVTATRQSSTRATLSLKAEDVATPGVRKLVIVNDDGTQSQPFELEVEAADT